MQILVSDVGGTNVRFALSKGGHVLKDTIQRFRNDDYDSWYSAAQTYLAHYSDIAATCVAVAGPVSGDHARLSNRASWTFHTDEIANAVGCDKAFLINDLSALGYCVTRLETKHQTLIRAASAEAHPNNQALVIGIGTGFNVAATYLNPTICMECEQGHVSPPASVMARLSHLVGGDLNPYQDVEDIFSGRGIEQAFAQATRRPRIKGQDIITAHEQGDPTATNFLTGYSEMIGALCHELVVGFLPMNGLYLAGSVACGVLNAGFHQAFVKGFEESHAFEEKLSRIPVSTINEDTAPLMGCAHLANVRMDDLT